MIAPPVDPAPQTLLARVQALQAASQAFQTAFTAAMRQISVDPAAALGALEDCLVRMDPLEAEDLAVLALMPGFDIEEKKRFWRNERIVARLSRCRALQLLARPADLAAEITAAEALVADQPDDPARADIAELKAEIATDPDEIQAQLDVACKIRLAHRQFLAAAQNRMRASTLAGLVGRVARLRACAAQAIDIVRRNGLPRMELQFRIYRFRSLLMGDITGKVREELRAQLDYTSRLSGTLKSDADLAFAEAFSRLAGVHAALEDGRPVEPPLHEAIAATTGFSLMVQAGRLADCLPTAPGGAASPDLPARVATALAELRRIHLSVRVDMLLLASEFKQKLGDLATPVDILAEAESVAATLPESLVQVLGAQAGLQDARGNMAKAIASAERAVQAAAGLASATTRAQAEAQLAELRARGGPAMQAPPGMSAGDFIPRRMLAAQQAMKDGNPAAALAIADALIAIAVEPQSRRQVLLGRAVALIELDRLAEAEADLLAAQGLLGDPAETEGDNPIEREVVAMLVALVQARAGRPRDAWNSAEAGRATAMRLAQGAAVPSWPDVAAWLARTGAAIVALAPLRWGTLVLSAAPGEAEPSAQVLIGFKAADVNAVLKSDLATENPIWNDLLFKAVPTLSAQLASPLKGRLRALAATASVLYIIPYDLLFLAPFAALELEAGALLSELVPLALAPSVALLMHWASRAPAASVRCLAVAAGKDVTGFDFAAHLKQVAAAPWPAPPTEISGDAATPAALAGAMADHTVLALSCHGDVNPGMQDSARASRIQLAAGQMLTAADVGTWPAVPGLAFLNACQSGRFRPDGRTELGGFPGALLAAGSRTVIAPLTHVDPVAAGDLEAAFFQAWLAGLSPAAALQAAQKSRRAAGAAPADWAAHVLFGPGAPGR